MKKNRKDYVICKICGASLDIGEKCDCQQININNKKSATILYPTQLKQRLTAKAQ